MNLIDRPPVDWSKPVRFNTGEVCAVERVMGYVMVTFGEIPAALKEFVEAKHFKDSCVVYEDDGSIVGNTDLPVWVENVERDEHPMEALIGTF